MRPNHQLDARIEADPQTTFSPELQLLLACCRALCRFELEAVPEIPDWHSFVALAEKHCLLGPVCQSLDRYSRSIPVWSELRSRLDAQARRALWLTQVLKEVLEAFAKRGVEAIPYKGPVLSEILYGNIGFRSYTDLDFLVRVQDVPAARQALGELGFQSKPRLSPSAERRYLSSASELVFDGAGVQNVIELQWRVLPRFYAIDLDMEPVFARAATIPFLGETVRSLCDEDLLLVLCVHAAKHLWCRLSWIYDIAALCARRPIRWEIVHERAADLGVTRILAITGSLASSLFGIQLPVDSAADPKALQRIFDRLPSAEQPHIESRAYFREIIDSRERTADRVRFLFRLATTPSVNEWNAVNLPDALAPLYRGVRFFRLVRKIF